jgi:hypothetical protein
LVLLNWVEKGASGGFCALDMYLAASPKIHLHRCTREKNSLFGMGLLYNRKWLNGRIERLSKEILKNYSHRPFKNVNDIESSRQKINIISKTTILKKGNSATRE